MKKYLYLMIALVIVGCTEQMALSENMDEPTKQELPNEIEMLKESARWGDGEAYLELANCYRDGKGVKKDFISMLTMVSLAESYGGINRMEDYWYSFPENSEFRLIVECIGKFMDKQTEEAQELVERVIANESADGYAIKGLFMIEQGDSIEGKRLFEVAAEKGSKMAELLLCVSDWREGLNPQIEKLEALTDKNPLACNILAKMYAGMGSYEKTDEAKAAYYYLKADQHACLSKRGAIWLLDYSRRGGDLHLSATDMERLQILAGEEVTQTPVINHSDPKLEAAITDLLKWEINDYIKWKKAMVYVVETNTGKIKANLAYEREGKKLSPYVDSYHQEQHTMVGAPTYLALLSSGKLTPENVFDTGCGIYGNIRDHNWRRGGYGAISLERALGVRSEVAFTMAKEYVYGENESEINAQINEYLGGNPNEAMGILTFYNAVANGGKMVKLVSEGEDGIVLHEQIAKPEHIKALQKGLENAVANGIFKKAGNYDTKVAACGRTFVIEGNYRRMELCGYFPAEKPMYTIMVIMEKEGLPASAGGMCGIILSNTINVLMDMYGMKS